MQVSASAPGKAFVTGEYAVARGGPAIIVAAGGRLDCHLEARRALCSGREAITIRRDTMVYRVPAQLDDLASIPPEVRFVAAALLVAVRALGLAGLDLTLDTRSELDCDGGKSGLGGSAAASAATVAAMHALAGREVESPRDAAQRIAEAVLAHRLAQGGGSAADVVAATLGGLTWVEGLDDRDTPASVAACAARSAQLDVAYRRLALPRGTTLELAATDRPIASGPRIARFGRAIDRESAILPGGGVLACWCTGMRTAVEAFRDACDAGNRTELLAAMRAGGLLLARLGAITGMPILTASLRRACRTGAERAAVKPSGAGGGDCAIAAVAEESCEWLRGAWRAAGLRPLATWPDAPGARCAPAGVVLACG